jgi:metal-responsive CopG/Arc/MetJ family transcriptional regulator
MKNEKKVSFTLFIDKEVMENIRKISKSHKRSRGAMIRIMIDEYIENGLGQNKLKG